MAVSVVQILDPADKAILLAGSFDLILVSVTVWRSKNQNQMNASNTSNFIEALTELGQ